MQRMTVSCAVSSAVEGFIVTLSRYLYKKRIMLLKQLGHCRGVALLSKSDPLFFFCVHLGLITFFFTFR
ncbi:hypothetical protein [Paenibacillus sp. DMB20]|uniref:hypothetical protein n=1 Tax=Paenibacillus sp. DMB20 TaxID=1642570 RepID=UPI002E0D5C12